MNHLMHHTLGSSSCHRSLLPWALSLIVSSSTAMLALHTPRVQADAASHVSSFPLTGLKNLGNTCYLNAQLQCAYHIPLVRNIIMEGGKLESNRADERKDSPGLQALRSVFVDMKAASRSGMGSSLCSSLSSSSSSSSGTSIRRSVSTAILTRTLGIPVMEQQDSQEFWKLLLPALQLPALTDLYQGSFEDYLLAQDGSGRGRVREETFLDISLNVPTVDANRASGSATTTTTTTMGSVWSSLEETFGAPELLKVSEGNGWRPEKGADKVDALKGSRLCVQGLPSILQLHLKRFTYDWNRNVMEKSNVPFSFQPELDLSALCKYDADQSHDDEKDNVPKDCLVYDLQGVVIHVGQYNVGHYYAYVRPNIKENRWFRINDEMIDEVTWDEVLRDGIGGKVSSFSQEEKPKKGFFKRIFRVFNQLSNGPSDDSPYGYGGSSANAYVLQYAKRSECDRLYNAP